MKHLAPLALAVALTAPLARADEPPDPGTKRVRFAFRVDGLAAHADWVVVAFPWSLSNGAPTREHAVIADGKPLDVGRRSPTVKLWGVRKAAWEAFAKGLPGEGRAREDALAAFVAGPGVVPCGEGPERVTTLPTSDPRDAVERTLVVRALDDQRCTLELQPEAAAAPPAGAKSGCAGGDVPALGLGATLALAVARLGRRRPLGERARGD